MNRRGAIRTGWLAFALILAHAPPSFAQQNQMPGFSGTGNQKSQAQHAQAGANTTHGTTNGISGPKSQGGGPPGNLALPGLPSRELCDSFDGEAHASCLSTVLNETAAPATGVRP